MRFCKIRKQIFVFAKFDAPRVNAPVAMLRKKVQEKDDEIKRLQQENAKLKEALPEGNILEETFNRR